MQTAVPSAKSPEPVGRPLGVESVGYSPRFKALAICDRFDVIRRIVFIVEVPFQLRDFHRFGLANLADHDLYPEVWEVHDVYAPRPRGESIFHPPGNVKIRRFQSEAELLKAASTLNGEDCLITTTGVYVGQEKSMEPLVVALSSSQAYFTALSSGHRLPVFDPALVNTSIPRRALALARRLSRDWRTNPRRVPIYLRSAWRRRQPMVESGVRALDAIWAGTGIESIQSRLVGCRTETMYIHALDYDLVRHCRQEPPGPAIGRIVYLDSMGPEHPDYRVHGFKVLSSAENWFSSLRVAFDHLERVLQLPIAIVPHPRATMEQVKEWYGEREVLVGSTARSIRDAELVLVTEATTSLGMVAALKKPCLGLRATMVHGLSHARLQAYSSALGFPLVDVDAIPDFLEIPIPDSDKQARFTERYVKKAGTAELDFWDVVAQQIKCWGS